MKKICIIGTGGYAKEIFWLIHDIGIEDQVECFMEPDDQYEERSIMDRPVLPQSQFDPAKHRAVIAIGNGRIREKVVQQLPEETEYPNIISPKAQVTRWAKLGRGCVIQSHTVVTVDVVLGDFVHLNCFTTVGHDTTLGDYSTTTAFVSISGLCTVGKHSYWGNGSSVRQGLSVTDHVTVGMGAMVVKPIEEPGIYTGIPAKKFK
ncbi:MAG: NeuD/PglB/VioB family sugar acetyltransferase [Bacteroidota bacterium]